MDIDALLTPPTATAGRALAVVRRSASSAIANHCLRSWAWAALLAPELGREYDAELLFVAAMLHDHGVVPLFDSHREPFEDAGGAVAAVFASGAGWDDARGRRVAEVVQRHMWTEVDPAFDAEGYLLEVATSLDVAGVGFERWEVADLRAVTARVPRLDFSAEFDAAIADQAIRKPSSSAARLHGAGRIAAGGKRWAAFLAG